MSFLVDLGHVLKADVASSNTWCLLLMQSIPFYDLSAIASTTDPSLRTSFKYACGYVKHNNGSIIWLDAVGEGRAKWSTHFHNFLLRSYKDTHPVSETVCGYGYGETDLLTL